MSVEHTGSSYVTTSIPYVNAAPHLGFALELCIADAFARHRRRRRARVRLVTGSDDHSLKNVLAAERAGVPVGRWVAEHAAAFEALGSALHVSADDFLRTSASPGHAAAVRALWTACAARGDLHRRAYRGLYCVGCERFYEASELLDGRCPEHEVVPELVEEENWFFRLSRYRDLVREAIERGRLRIVHEGAREETLAFLRGPVQDLSVSRAASRARGWGLPVPGDPTQVIWVWFDALAYYLAALGYGGPDQALLDAFWSAPGERVHVIGKGVTRFHAVFWPAFLASAGLPWPTDLLVHGYLTVDGVKISKSGKTLDPLPVIERHGADALRWYLLRHVRTARDGDFSQARFTEAHDAELANGVGNLVARVLALAVLASEGRVPAAGVEEAEDAALRAAGEALPGTVAAAFDALAVDQAAQAAFAYVDETNRYLNRTEPWKLLRTGRTARARAVVRNALEALHVLAGELEPFLPATAGALHARLGAQPSGADGRTWGCLGEGALLGRGEPLFQRTLRSGAA